jgi:hypothetical protein
MSDTINREFVNDGDWRDGWKDLGAPGDPVCKKCGLRRNAQIHKAENTFAGRPSWSLGPHYFRQYRYDPSCKVGGWCNAGGCDWCRPARR